MDAATIQPFIDATGEVFGTMLQAPPVRGQIALLQPADAEGDLSAVIGLSGTVRGTVAVMLAPPTAQTVTRRMLAMEGEAAVGDADVVDAIGELANMIAGCAKAKLDGHNISIGLPSVVRGLQYRIEHPTNTRTVAVPFDSPLGTFRIAVTLSQNGK